MIILNLYTCSYNTSKQTMNTNRPVPSGGMVWGAQKNPLFWLVINYIASYKYTAVKGNFISHVDTTSPVMNYVYMLKVLLTNKDPHFEFICVTMPGLEPPSIQKSLVTGLTKDRAVVISYSL